MEQLIFTLIMFTGPTVVGIFVGILLARVPSDKLDPAIKRGIAFAATFVVWLAILILFTSLDTRRFDGSPDTVIDSS